MSLVDLTKVQITSTGTGALALGAAVPGFRGIEALTNGISYSYSIMQGGNYEIGTGIFSSSGPSFARSPAFSSAGGSPIDLAGGAQLCFTARAHDIARNWTILSGTPATLITMTSYGLRTSAASISLPLPALDSISPGDWIEICDIDFNASSSPVAIVASGSDQIALYDASSGTQQLNVAGARALLMANIGSWRMIV